MTTNNDAAIQPTLPRDAAAIETSLAVMESAAHGMVIETTADYEFVAGEVKRANEYAKALEAKRMELTRPLDNLKAQWMALFEPRTSAAKRVVEILKGKLLAFEQGQARLRREAEAKARAEREAEERARAEAARREREEIERREREARAAAEAERLEAQRKAAQASDEIARKRAEQEAEQALQRERDALEQAALEREALRQKQEAEQFTPSSVIAEHVPAAPKVSGVSKRVTWRVADIDLKTLVIHAAAAAAKGDESLLALLKADSAAIGKRVRAMGEHARIPGVTVEAAESLAVGSR